MEISALMAISPLDGRYQEKTKALRPIFSEFGLIKFRTIIEIQWLKALADYAQLPEIAKLSTHARNKLDDICDHFSEKDAQRVKQIESTINHDVKAVEYFIKEHLEGNKELSSISEFIHFGCTSEDVNNMAYSLMLQTARTQCILPALDELMQQLRDIAHRHAAIAMLSRTHGQSATPTTVGKEIANIIARLQRQITQLSELKLSGKLNGATGNYNAFDIAYPDIDWQAVSRQFIENLNLAWNPYTTQIEPHDTLAEFFNIMQRINTILIDLDRDVWSYISLNYFKQKAIANEVGSSTMPHKINPIDFENSEGNLGIANALFEHMAGKLPISRWQRDLSDSTVLRNMGVAIGHSLLAWQSTMKGLKKLEPNEAVIQADLDQHWEVLAEAIQTVMRRYKIEQPYEKLKNFTRGKTIDKTLLQNFINELKLPAEVKNKLLKLQPGDYTGYAEKLAKNI